MAQKELVGLIKFIITSITSKHPGIYSIVFKRNFWKVTLGRLLPSWTRVVGHATPICRFVGLAVSLSNKRERGKAPNMRRRRRAGLVLLQPKLRRGEEQAGRWRVLQGVLSAWPQKNGKLPVCQEDQQPWPVPAASSCPNFLQRLLLTKAHTQANWTRKQE